MSRISKVWEGLERERGRKRKGGRKRMGGRKRRGGGCGWRGRVGLGGLRCRKDGEELVRVVGGRRMGEEKFWDGMEGKGGEKLKDRIEG